MPVVDLHRRATPSRRWLAGALLCAAACWASAAQAQPLSIVDDRGTTVVFQAPPQRIVSLLPSLTETLCALGACDRLVGIDRWSNWPPEVRSLPTLGGIDDVALEALVRLKPDVVLAARSQRLLQRLEGLGLKVLALESDRHEDVQRSLQMLARLLGRPEAGDQAWQTLQMQIDAAAARVPQALRGRRVMLEIGAGGYLAGPQSFVGQTLSRLGMANIAPRDAGPFPKISGEYVLRQQPDVLITTSRELATLPQRPGWSALRAVQRQQWCGLEPAAWDALVRPGPRLGEAAGLLAGCLEGLERPRQPGTR